MKDGCCISGTMQRLPDVIAGVTKGKACVICCTESAYVRAKEALMEAGNRKHVDVMLLSFEGVDEKKYDTLFLYGDKTGAVTKAFFHKGTEITLVADSTAEAMAQAQLVLSLGREEYRQIKAEELEEAKKRFHWADEF